MTNYMRSIKTFCLRAGRMTERQRLGYERHLKNYDLRNISGVWDLQNIFKNNNPVILEIGFGMGDSLFLDAKTAPDTNIIGAEVHKPGIGHLAYLLQQENINNVKIYPNDVHEMINNNLSYHCLDGIRIFFPDPWPKKRHHKRRLITSEFIKKILPYLKDNGWIHCATDWEEYAFRMLEIFQAIPELKNQATNGEFYEANMLRAITKFETRGKKLGHKIYDLIFAKQL
jgi:tRNA (guanine-N7-)-methyltransferase